MPSCFVYGCRKTSKTSNIQKDGITFHLFPQNLLQRRKWTEACSRSKEWIPTPTSSICSRHFEVSQFVLTETNRRQLKKDAIPSLLLNKHELDMANLNNDISTTQRIPRVIPKSIVSPTLHKKTSTGGSYTLNERATSAIPKTNSKDLKKNKKNEPIENLQMFIKQLMPNIKDSDAIYVVLVNNDQSEVPEHLANRTDYSLAVRNQFEVGYLRTKLAKKTELAERRLKTIRSVRESRRRLIKKNLMLTKIINQMRAENLSRNIVSQFDADPVVVNPKYDMKSDSEPDDNDDGYNENGEDYIGTYDDDDGSLALGLTSG